MILFSRPKKRYHIRPRRECFQIGYKIAAHSNKVGVKITAIFEVLSRKVRLHEMATKIDI